MLKCSWLQEPQQDEGVRQHYNRISIYKSWWRKFLRWIAAISTQLVGLQTQQMKSVKRFLCSVSFSHSITTSPALLLSPQLLKALPRWARRQILWGSHTAQPALQQVNSAPFSEGNKLGFSPLTRSDVIFETSAHPHMKMKMAHGF